MVSKRTISKPDYFTRAFAFNGVKNNEVLPQLLLNKKRHLG